MIERDYHDQHLPNPEPSVKVVSQSRKGSVFETVTNTAVGFAINWGANLVILPLFGLPITGGQAFHMGLIFTAISIARGYVLRRVFNRITEWRAAR